MDKDTFTLNNQTYSNNNILFEIITELQQISNSSHENLTIKRIRDIIIKMNFIINENRKNMGLIMNQFTKLENQISQPSQNLKFNNINNQQELNGENWRYIGQVVNGLREGKGIEYYISGNRYEGDWRNEKKEGKGVFYYNNGDRRMGDYSDDKPIGKYVTLTKNGEVKTNNY